MIRMLYIRSVSYTHLQPITKGNIASIYEDSAKELWIGSWEEGLYHIKKDGSIENFRHDPKSPNSLCSDFVRSCCEDNAGNLWIGTFHGLNLSLIHISIVSITLVMMAVFVPVSFMGGTAGTFYRQFGMTMAIAIGLSALNALTLSPALCAVLLKPHKKEDGTTEDSTLKERMKVAYTAAHTTMINRYTEAIGKMLHPGITLTFTLIAILGMIFGLFSINPVSYTHLFNSSGGDFLRAR